MSVLTVADVERAIHAAFPPERAEPWDRVGLLAGDPEAVVAGVVLALDPTVDVVKAAVRCGANVVVTHHPAFITPPERITSGLSGGAAIVHEAIAHGVALINAHTNLDRDARAQRLIPEMLGLEPLHSLETAPQPRTIVTVYVPPVDASRVVEAMTGAGAGRIGDYERCSFTVEGVGAFTPGQGTHPCVGDVGEPSSAAEARIEMVCPKGRVGAVVAAASSAHPYQEPLVTTTDVGIAPNGAALGMVSSSHGHAALTLGDLATLAGQTFSVNPRVWGAPDRLLKRIATATGSAGSLVGPALQAGADALVAGEVRYHDALDASARGLCVVEIGHDVSEWPLVGLLARVVKGIAGIDPDLVTTLPSKAGWWTPDNREGA